jgi:hypothetical protein
MRAVARWTSLGAVAVGCSRAPGASSAPAPPSGIASAPSPAVGASSGNADAPAPCSIAAGYRGSVAGQPVFARLVREGSALHGRYFYERVGVDLPLDGTLTGNGGVLLTEGPASKPTGHFVGTCDPSGGGAIDGTWEGATTRGAFHLQPIAPGEVPVAAKKHFVAAGRVRGASGGTMTTCTYQETRVELFGLRDGDLEARINGQRATQLGTTPLAPDVAQAATTCTEGFWAEEAETVVAAFRELVTLETNGSIDGGWAHPNELPLVRRTIDLRTGRPVTAGDVFVRRPPMARVAACAARASPYGATLDAEEWEGHFGPDALDLQPDGVHFFADGFPHVAAVLDGEGPVLGYDVLLRDGALRSDSPVKRAWEGVEPAPATADPCPAGKVTPWWR